MVPDFWYFVSRKLDESAEDSLDFMEEEQKDVNRVRDFSADSGKP